MPPKRAREEDAEDAVKAEDGAKDSDRTTKSISISPPWTKAKRVGALPGFPTRRARRLNDVDEAPGPVLLCTSSSARRM